MNHRQERIVLTALDGALRQVGLLKPDQFLPSDQLRIIARAAQGIEAGTDETLQAAQPEGQEPGGVAMRPDTPSSQDTDQ